jgi:HEAT repeat protein
LQLLNTLAAIGTPEARQVVERFTTDADPDVVRAAKDALARFPGRSQSRFER